MRKYPSRLFPGGKLPDWLKSAGEVQSLNGFKWSGGEECTTSGMWMWAHRLSVGTEAAPKKIAVLLVDTEGLHASGANQLISNMIFGLATLISSYQIHLGPASSIVSLLLLFTC
jgi:Guanylate-binding protein, N-terminal domain